ncbi:MAG: phosphatase PAP2 family protein, partial [Selenomonadaceae bacterium]|nr:phosphatase PAP2 family protein [Selenomonadaceae bacterium]
IPKSPLSALIPGILFWCISRRAGLFLLFLASFGRLVNTLIKDTFCVYRPWILDPSVQPAAEAMQKASSYSMPSGHTQLTTAIYGGLAYLYRKKYPLLIIPCAIIILAVAFSRNFLGVHTPQDVLIAIVETLAVIFLADKIFDEVEKDNHSTKIIFGAGIIFCAISAIYILAKSYPVDYFGGKVIVTEAGAKIDSLDSIGCTLGFLIGVALENKFVNFSTKVDLGVKIRRVLIGGIVGGVAMIVMYSFKLLGFESVYEFCKGFLPILSITFLAPFAFNYFETKTKFRFKKLGNRFY